MIIQNTKKKRAKTTVKYRSENNIPISMNSFEREGYYMGGITWG